MYLTDPLRVLLVDTRRWNIRAGSVSFSLSDDSSTVAAAIIACVTSRGNGDGVRDDDDPIDGIDNGDLLAIIFLVSTYKLISSIQFVSSSITLFI